MATKWALRSVDASEDQQRRVSGILRGPGRGDQDEGPPSRNREAFARPLGGATVDRAALEEVRKAELALAEEASQLLVKTLADAAEVLTPEQRRQLLEYAHRFHRAEAGGRARRGGGRLRRARYHRAWPNAS